MVSRLAIIAAFAAGCSNASAGYYGSGYLGDQGGGGGGDVAATLVNIGGIDFTSFTSAQDLTASGDGSYVLEDGATASVYNTADGTLDVLASGAGLDFTTSANQGVTLAVALEDEGWLTYGAYESVIGVVKFDTANTDITTTSAYAFCEWSGNDSDATAAGNLKHNGHVKYDGATYDIDGFTWDGTFRNIPQEGNVAGFPEFLICEKYGAGSMRTGFGEDAGTPNGLTDLDTLDYAAFTAAVPDAAASLDPEPFSATSKHWFRFGGGGALYTDIRILSVEFYRFQ